MHDHRIPTAALSFISFLSCVLLAAGCGSGAGAGVAYPTADSFPPSAHFTPTEAPTGPEVGELAGRFYGAGEFDPTAFDREIAALLERYPGNATLNEMAAEMAMLRADIDARFGYLMTAAADLGTPFADLYVDLAFEENTTVSQQSAAIELLEALRTTHPSHQVRVAVTDRLLRLLKARGDLEAARELTPTLGMLDRFLLVGAFDNDQGKGFLERYAPETGIDVRAPMQGVLRSVEWREATLVDDRGRIALGDMVTPVRYSVAYLATWVRSPAARDAQLRLSTSCPVRAWVGGRLVASEENLSRGEIDDVIVPVRLERGWNLLLIKSANKGGNGWTIGARLTDEVGASLPGLEVSTTPRDSAGTGGVQAESDGALEDLSLPAALSDVAEAARRSLLESRYRIRSGRKELALEAAQAALEAAEGHPAALLRAARAHWNHREMGRAADLLNEGVDSVGDWAHVFRWKRGRFYSQRDRYDRAGEDLLAVVEAQPDARVPRMELSKVFKWRGFDEDRCDVLEEVLERWPDNALAYRWLGDCLNDRGYLDQSEEAYRRAHALEPGNLAAIGWLAYFDRLRGRWDDAIAMRDRARAIAPESGSRILQAADVRRQAGRRDEARQLYRLIIERDPDWAQPWARLAMMAFEDGNQDRAIASWQEALERNPDDSRLAERLDYYGAGEDAAENELMPSDADIAEALAALDAATPHPGAHTLWGLDDEVTVVRQDGSAQRMVTQVMKALTTTGRDQLIQQRLPRNARILSAYVRTADGDRQEASSIRDGTVRFRRLDDGATVVLQYVTDSPARGFLPNHFVSSWWFSGHHRQTLRGRWVILLPPGRPLVTRILGEIDHEESQTEEHSVHTFTATDIEPFVPEPGMIPAADLLWHVSASTLETWDGYVAWERALLSEVFRDDTQLEALAARLTEGVTEPQARFDRLFHFVAQEIRYQQDYENSIAGVRPHSCPIVLERGYGDCKDKAVLLIRLAQEVGIDVNFAVLRTRPRGLVEREVPNQQFNHAIVYVPTQPGIAEGFFADPTTDGLDIGNLRRDDQGATSLVLNPRDDSWEFREIPYQAPDLRYFRYTIEVDIEGRDTATANAEIRARGDIAGVLRRRMRNAEEATNLYEGLATQLFDGSRVTTSQAENEDDIVAPLKIELSLDVSDSIRPEGQSHRIQVPQITPLRGMSRLESRHTPIYMGAPFERHMDITYRLPRGGRVVRMPDTVEVEHECFTATQRASRRGRSVRVRTTYVQRCPEISVEQYPEYRQMAQRAAAALESEIVFDVR